MLQKLKGLPEEYSRMVEEYLDFLTSKLTKKKVSGKPDKTKKAGIPGLAKGKLWIAPDFDDPLDEMKEYADIE